ncbi:PINc domain-containing protein [Caenorhabditis elegans]|uniref:PINc domain-containing protein n=1 Tax=Caenorhabditis elegans TaxID=6239 RepID=Q9BL69_CAEEL|nr:PINc domain-containing protein [Caenorhabditis elegans]CCD68645.1 PINc domain-containing protein [Caenorhabditis elegans]|eukprot:NP_497565.1 Suppressor with Morphological effect on Genitalia [Caenorhabditis elegans]
MNGDTDASSSRTGAPRKPRPEIQIYRPGMLRQGGSTKSLSSTNEEARPPRPEKLNTTTTTMSGNSRRRSNDTDSVTSRGGSGSTTPDANVINAMNERGGGRNRFEKGYRQQQRTDGPSNYNSTQSLYDTRQHGGYMEYQGNHRSNHRNNGRYSNQQHQQHRQPFERPGGNHYTRGFNERASMRGDGAIARRPQGSRRQRNDSINSTQSEMPPQTGAQLHIDTSFDSASQCGASSNFSMNSLGEAFSFEEMCQNLQNFASMDWSKEVENEFAMQKEQEEEEERRMEQKLQEAAAQEAQKAASPRRNNRRNNRRGGGNSRYHPDESDRESSFGGSIAEEKEEEEAEEELKSGERTPTSVRSGNSYNPRVLYQRTRGANDENHPKRRDAAVEKKPKEPRRYRGEHDDRDDDASEYHGTLENHMSSGRLAGRIQIVQRSQNGTEAGGNRNRQSSEEKPRTYQKRR